MTLYVTAAEFKAEYKDIVGAADDAFIARALQAAQDAIETGRYGIGRVVLADSDTTHYFDADGPSVDSLDLWVSDIGDLCSITTVTNGDSVVVTSGQYTTYPKTLTNASPSYTRIRLLPNSGVTWTWSTDPENAISIVGKWGMWSTIAAVPESFTLSVMELTAFFLESRKSQVFDTVAIPDAGIIQIPSGWPASVMARLEPYRRMPA